MTTQFTKPAGPHIKISRVAYVTFGPGENETIEQIAARIKRGYVADGRGDMSVSIYRPEQGDYVECLGPAPACLRSNEGPVLPDETNDLKNYLREKGMDIPPMLEREATREEIEGLKTALIRSHFADSLTQAEDA